MSEPSLRSTAIREAVDGLGMMAGEAGVVLVTLGVDAALRVIHTQRDVLIDAGWAATWPAGGTMPGDPSLMREDVALVVDAVLATLGATVDE